MVPLQDKQDLETILTYLYDTKPDMKIFTYLTKKNWLDESGLRLLPHYQPTSKSLHAPLIKEAIEHIVVKEEMFLGKELCCTIFLDFIKEKALINNDEFLDLGVVPIFLRLEELIQNDTEIAAICGLFLIISDSLLEKEKQLMTFQLETITTEPKYKKINLNDSNRAELTKLITNLLNKKIINILVGTVSFLGEGWNCPNINTIILGNSASSFVQTQQLRGRGLRLGDKNHLTNIWHISPVYSNVPLSEQTNLAPIIKRLSFIEGLDFIGIPSITSDIERFELPSIFNAQQINARITENFEKAKKRNFFFEEWQSALYKGSQLAMPVSIKSSTESIKTIPLNSSLEEPDSTIEKKSKENFFKQFKVWFFPKLRKKRRWRLYCNQLEKNMIALRNLLIQEGIIFKNEDLVFEWNEHIFNCSLETERYFVKNLFNRLSMEVLSEIDDSRYLLKIDQHYFVVPKSYGINREKAELFYKFIFSELPNTKLFYTKNIEGRKELMNAYFVQEKKEVWQNKVWR